MQLEYIEGILKIGNVVLCIFAGVLALGLLKYSSRIHGLKAWNIFIGAIFLFIMQEILGMLRAFGIYEHPYLTHIIPSFLLLLLIWLLIVEVVKNFYCIED